MSFSDFLLLLFCKKKTKNKTWYRKKIARNSPIWLLINLWYDLISGETCGKLLRCATERGLWIVKPNVVSLTTKMKASHYQCDICFLKKRKKNPHEMEWWLTSKSNLDILVKAFGCIFTYFHLTFFLMDFVDREYITRTHIASIYVHFFVVYWLILLLWKRVFSLYGYRIEPIQSRNLMHAPHHIR